MGEVVAESTTKSDGGFKIENIQEGEYNFVALKGGFGWKYVYNVPINTGSITSMTQLLNDRMTQLPNNPITQLINNSITKSLNNPITKSPNNLMTQLLNTQMTQSHNNTTKGG